MIKKPNAVLQGRPETAQAYLTQLDEKAARDYARGQRRTPKVTPSPARLTAYINQGRWVADCPICDAGISVHPQWPIAGCFECCTRYADIVVPDEWQAIEAVLEARPRIANQNWTIGESVAHLQAESAGMA